MISVHYRDKHFAAERKDLWKHIAVPD